MSDDVIAKYNLTPTQIALVKAMAPQEWADYEKREITNNDYGTLVQAAIFARRLDAQPDYLLKLLDRAHTTARRHSNALTRYHQRPDTETGRKAHERAEHWWDEFESLMNQIRSALRADRD
jgi:hypothetical protein